MAHHGMKRMRMFLASKGHIPLSRVAEAEHEEKEMGHQVVDPGEGIPSPVHGQGEDHGYYDMHDLEKIPEQFFDGGEVEASGIEVPENEEHELDGHDGPIHYGEEGPEIGMEGDLIPSSKWKNQDQFAYGGKVGSVYGKGAVGLEHEIHQEEAGKEIGHSYDMTPAGRYKDPANFAYGGMAKGGMFHGKSMKPGGGGQFEKLKTELSHKPGISDPGALAAKIGRAKYGKSKFQKMASTGRHRAALARAIKSKG